MIAMQYSFVLPADYDMAIIDRRIDEKGPLLDNFPNLGFKAYLTARKGDGASRENLYAPFYVWNHPDGLNDFICGEGFAALTQSFGWPRVTTWIVWKAALSPEISHAAFATREIRTIKPYTALGDLRRQASEEAAADVKRGGALASVAGFEPTNWTLVRFRLWMEMPHISGDGVQTYEVGHLSLPGVHRRR